MPNVPPLFWSFRIMVGIGLLLHALFARRSFPASRRKLARPWFLRLALFSMPLPWIAAELGWIVAEYGRQPWAIDGVLPTSLAVVESGAQSTSLAGFIVFYTALLVVECI